MPRGLRDGGFCPHRIIEDFGQGFNLGAVLGGVGHFIRGFYIYPKSEKFAGGIKNMKRRMPMFATNFGLWCGLYGFGQCALLYTTGYDNHLTEVAAAFFAGFTLDVRSGVKTAIRRGFGASVFIGIMGIGEIIYSKYQLGKTIDLKNKINYIREQRELIQLKAQYPQFANIVTDSAQRLRELEREVEIASGQRSEQHLHYFMSY